MPKMKTRKAAAKRFHITGSGKITRYKSKKRHLLEHKSRSLLRQSSKRILVSKTDRQRIRQMIGGIQNG